MAKELQSDAPTASTVYAIVRRRTDGQVWSVSGGAFENFVTANYANYPVTMTEAGTASGYYTGTFPATIGAGLYDAIYLIKVGGSFSETADTKVSIEQIQWSGSAPLSLNVIPLVTLVTTTTTVTNQLTAAAIATGVWQDATAGDFTVASSIGKALYIANVVPGAAGGHFIAGTNAATTVTTSFTTTFTGNLTGSVGSVTGLTASNLDATISSRMATYTQPTGFLAATFPTTVASTTNITAGTITTVTNLTNAPTSGDFTAVMKSSIGTAVAASAVASVTGNVGGNVTGSVGSVAGNVSGNVVGSVGSVAGNVSGSVASVVGNVGGNVTGSIGSVATGGITAASIADNSIDTATFAAGTTIPRCTLVDLTTLATTTTNLTNLPTAPTDWITAAALSAGAVTEIQAGLATSAALTTATKGIAPVSTGQTLQGAGATTATLGSGETAGFNFYKGYTLRMTSGISMGLSTIIYAYDDGTKIASISPNWPTTPAAGDSYEVYPIGHVMVDALNGARLQAAAATNIATFWNTYSSPWAVPVPGAFASGTAGFILGTYITGAPLDAAGVRAAVGLATNNLDTQLADIPTVAEFEARTIVAANYAQAVKMRKNVAFSGFKFPMRTTAGAVGTGLTVTARRIIDAGAIAACTNAVTEVSNGTYRLDLSAADLNGDDVMLIFTATGALQLEMKVTTQP